MLVGDDVGLSIHAFMWLRFVTKQTSCSSQKFVRIIWNEFSGHDVILFSHQCHHGAWCVHALITRHGLLFHHIHHFDTYICLSGT